MNTKQNTEPEYIEIVKGNIPDDSHKDIVVNGVQMTSAEAFRIMKVDEEEGEVEESQEDENELSKAIQEALQPLYDRVTELEEKYN